MLTKYISKFNTICRLLLVGLLVYPTPVLADETTEYERISDTGQNTTDITFDYGGSSWNRLDIHSGQCGSNNQAVHYNMQNLEDQTITITFPEDTITTAGFLSGCVNDPYPVTWTYSDGTTETVNYNAQSNEDVATMFEIVSKTITDKYITSVAIEYDDYVIIDDIYWTYATTPTTTTSSTTTTTTPHLRLRQRLLVRPQRQLQLLQRQYHRQLRQRLIQKLLNVITITLKQAYMKLTQNVKLENMKKNKNV